MKQTFTHNPKSKHFCCWCEKKVLANFEIRMEDVNWKDHACREHFIKYFAPHYKYSGLWFTRIKNLPQLWKLFEKTVKVRKHQ